MIEAHKQVFLCEAGASGADGQESYGKLRVAKIFKKEEGGSAKSFKVGVLRKTTRRQASCWNTRASPCSASDERSRVLVVAC